MIAKALRRLSVTYCLWWCVVLVVLRPSGMFDTLQAFPQSS